MKFYLGTHQTDWLSKTTIPLFVSHSRLSGRKTLPRALCAWALDSGAFSEIAAYGRFRTSPVQYAASVRRYAEEIGGMEWCASQDWMCEDYACASTGLEEKLIRPNPAKLKSLLQKIIANGKPLTPKKVRDARVKACLPLNAEFWAARVLEHQRRTIDNYLELKAIAPEINFVPVIQGWFREDYERHVQDYLRAGVDLRELYLVGLGSICRRQQLKPIHALARQFSADGIRLHGFGVKLKGLKLMADSLISADSMAWSYAGRNAEPMPGHTHKNCANCRPYAELWYRRVQGVLSQPRQQWLLAA